MTTALNNADHLLIRAARGEAVERPPVWAMRQAGRWDPCFRGRRGDLDFFSFSEDVERATAATLCPRRFGVDGIILFYDIVTLPVAMGLPFTLQPGRGPVPDSPIASDADLDKLDPDPDPDRYRHILDLLAAVQKELAGELPVLAFAGSPFTVASYCVGTGKDVDATRRFAAERPAVWGRLLDTIGRATVGFLNTLTGAGVAMYQLFDSWAGDLTREEYDRWAQPHHEAILSGATGVPRVLFVKEGPYLDRMAAAGADAVSLGSRHDLAQARADYPHLVFQGNVDNEILRDGPVGRIETEVKRCLAEGGGRRHIVNLNHGVDKQTPPENFEAYIRAARGEASA